MPSDFIIKPFLEAHRAEVKGMLLTEYDEAEQMELFKEDGRREGRKEGRKEGREEGRKEGFLDAMLLLVQDGVLSVKEAAERAGMTENEFRQRLHL